VMMGITSFDTLPFSCMDLLGIGAIMAYSQDKVVGSSEAAAKFTQIMKWIGLPSFAVFFAASIARINIPGAAVLADLAAAFAFGWLVSRTASSFKGPVGTLLELRPIRYIGRISYGIYILHSFMPVILFYLLKWSHLSLSEDSGLRFLLLVGMSVAAASLSWRFLESPINAYKRYFEYARTRRKPEIQVKQVEYSEALA
jgi:peptidoglycan/LPS O-acetylase OafA/YrhL